MPFSLSLLTVRKFRTVTATPNQAAILAANFEPAILLGGALWRVQVEYIID
jgi:hypothetical protein